MCLSSPETYTTSPAIVGVAFARRYAPVHGRRLRIALIHSLIAVALILAKLFVHRLFFCNGYDGAWSDCVLGIRLEAWLVNLPAQADRCDTFRRRAEARAPRRTPRVAAAQACRRQSAGTRPLPRDARRRLDRGRWKLRARACERRGTSRADDADRARRAPRFTRVRAHPSQHDRQRRARRRAQRHVPRGIRRRSQERRDAGNAALVSRPAARGLGRFLISSRA